MGTASAYSSSGTDEHHSKLPWWFVVLVIILIAGMVAGIAAMSTRSPTRAVTTQEASSISGTQPHGTLQAAANTHNNTAGSSKKAPTSRSAARAATW